MKLRKTKVSELKVWDKYKLSNHNNSAIYEIFWIDKLPSSDGFIKLIVREENMTIGFETYFSEYDFVYTLPCLNK